MPKNQQTPRMQDTVDLAGYYGLDYNESLAGITGDDGRPITAVDDEAPPSMANDNRRGSNGAPKNFRRLSRSSY